MGSQHWPIVLIEIVLVFGGVLAFGWWQLRSIERDRQEAARKKALQQQDASAPTDGAVRAPAPAPEPPR